MDESGAPGGTVGGEGDDTTGHELRQFFLDLLAEKNLQAYHEDRAEYVRTRNGDGLIGDEATELLLDGSLREIEEHIKRVTGSANAWPVMVVFPPI
jgi:hypothetical protein